MKKIYHTPIIEIENFEYKTNIASLLPSENNLDANLTHGESDMWEDL